MINNKFEDYDLIDLKNNREPESALLADAWMLLLRKKILFIVCLALSLAMGYYYIRSTPKKYMRTATVMVKDAQMGTGMVESQTFEDIFSLGRNSVENEVGIFKSRRLMHLVAEKLNLNMNYRALNLKKTDIYLGSPIIVEFIDANENASVSMVVTLKEDKTVELSEMTANQEYNEQIDVQIGDTVKTLLGRVAVLLNSNVSKYDVNSEILVSRSPIKAVANGFCQRLSVEASAAQSSLINLTIIDENYKRAEDILNTLIDVYNQDAIRDKNQITVNTASFIEERLRIIEADLNVVDSEIENYKKQHRLTDLSSESNVFLTNSNKLDNDGLSLDNQLNMAEYMKIYLLRNSKTSEMIPASIGIQDNGIQTQIIDYNEQVAKRNKLLTNSSERNPLIKNMDATLKSQRNAIVRAIDNLQTSLKFQVMNMKAKEQDTFDKITNLPTQQKQIVSIERQQKIKEELYLYLLNKKEENELQQIVMESNCKIVDTADGPISPVSPNKIQVILICLIIGISVPSLWLYLKSLLNTSVHSKEDIKDKVSIPFLGELPFDKVKEDRDIMLSSEAVHEHLNEALRIIRENLNFMNHDSRKQGGKIIQLISLNPSSGKTFLSINLAANIALSGVRVIVLDLDLRKASLTRRLRIGTKRKGMSNYLSGEVTDVESVIYTIDTSCESFDVISSGPIPPNPAELLKDGRLDDILAKLKQKYDYVLFDNPPYGLVVDAFVCSRLADYSIYVIRSGMFDKRLFPDLQELYNSNKIKNLSIVLNGVNYEKMAYNYRYSYGYHYYHYGAEHKKETKLKRFCKKCLGIKTRNK